MNIKKETKKQKEWKKKYPNGKAFLEWTLADYELWKIDPPECLSKKPSLTEGQQMTDEEIEEWFIDSIKTLKILKETEPEIFTRLYKELILDIEYLISIRRLEKKYLKFILNENNFNF